MPGTGTVNTRSTGVSTTPVMSACLRCSIYIRRARESPHTTSESSYVEPRITLAISANGIRGTWPRIVFRMESDSDML